MDVEVSERQGIATAQDIDLEDATPYIVGNCLITTVFLTDGPLARSRHLVGIVFQLPDQPIFVHTRKRESVPQLRE
jgi:hypothetical protein